MKRSEALIYSPALIAVLVAIASIATFISGSMAPATVESAPVSVVAPAPVGDVPFLGEVTVTATPLTAADLSNIAAAASI